MQDLLIGPDDQAAELAGLSVRDTHQPAQAQRTAADIPRLISAQLVDVARARPDKPVELTLNPEELGRVRMTFQTDSSSMNVVLQIERPETLDLMRRHIQQLAQDMHALGYDDVSFSFQHKEDGAASDGQTGNQTTLNGPIRAHGEKGEPAPGIVHITVGEGAGLDIRL
ncbi:flagellar hook-length control protein FliK [Aliiroseovarius sediminis]|uniref:flagellar hook-length control protein FliK n=1 Tax=Aliiroseovarius sediminis TaxID=2925839 RepID=UPI001F5AB5C8|nr:flagellar hook-length control protein FliK [Aliiroseovarius sediminis]MCI2394740.1 flagellar hook-length control protein FliK [Aliiroseovarius sediminis]